MNACGNGRVAAKVSITSSRQVPETQDISGSSKMRASSSKKEITNLCPKGEELWVGIF
jgi:hypothetical protein